MPFSVIFRPPPPHSGSGHEREPYRLYNLDVFEYELQETMALYGSIPYMLAHSPKRTAGVLFLNSAEMWIDVQKATHSRVGTILNKLKSVFASEAPEPVPQVDTHWFAESGIIDLFVFYGPTPKDVFSQYAAVSGTSPLPPLFSIAYHQCRWNYNDQEDVASVDRNMDASEIPMDVVWLDIEHSDGKKWMTWDASKFPQPEAMQNALAKKGRKMVNIVDPHIKRTGGYHVHEQAESQGHYVKNKDGKDYEGWCWPGSSSWLDFMSPTVRDWWAGLFNTDVYKGTTESMYFWNDMVRGCGEGGGGGGRRGDGAMGRRGDGATVGCALLSCYPVSHALLCSPYTERAQRFQRARSDHAQRRHSLRRLGAPRGPQHLRHVAAGVCWSLGLRDTVVNQFVLSSLFLLPWLPVAILLP